MSTAPTAEDVKVASEIPRPEEIADHLRQLLTSPTFSGSRRCQQFLKYVCEKALAGEMGALKERCLAIDVFGRQPDVAGHGEDTIVRVSAREVRKRLAQYYATAEGSAAAVQIELPSGSYVPEFHYRLPPKKLELEPAVETKPAPSPVLPPPEVLAVPQPAPWSGRRALAFGACGVLLLVGSIFLINRQTVDNREAAFQRFWSPIFRSSSPLLIGVGHPLVYQPSHRASMLSEGRRPRTPFPTQRELELAPNELNGADMVPVFNQFVGFGDMVAANEVSQMLAHRSRTIRLMLASSIPFADLKQYPTYLIGSLSNHWTMELGQTWRFRFNWTASLQPEFIDTLPGSKREWTIPSQDDGSTPEDYSMICRIRNSPTGRMLIVSAGIKQFGTEAAGRILADPSALGTILNKLAPGWEEKNLQIILHMRVIGNTPAEPELVAFHVW